MSSQYIRSLEKCASEQSRRVRIYGVGNGIHTPDDPYNTQRVPRQAEETSKLDWSTLALGLLLILQAILIFQGLLNDAGFRPGLFYDYKILRLGVIGFMTLVSIVVALFHYWIVVQAFESHFMRALSIVACSAIFFVGFHVAFLLSGGFAHFQVNAVDLHCSKVYNEQECLHARSRMEGMSNRHRRMLARTSSIYGRNIGNQTTEADVALVSWIRNDLFPLQK